MIVISHAGTDRQTGRQTGRQTDIQRDRQREADRQAGRHSLSRHWWPRWRGRMSKTGRGDRCIAT